MKYPAESVNDLSRGIFWVVAESESELDAAHILAFAKPCDKNGVFADFDGLSSADGTDYNHKATWATLPKNLAHGKPFDYYPRGRVEIRNGKAIIWLNDNLVHLADEIKRIFGLQDIPVFVRVDGSEHYQCHFDKM